jgi:hypothetical protein
MFLSSKNLTAYCWTTGITAAGFKTGNPPKAANDWNTCIGFTVGKIKLTATALGFLTAETKTSSGLFPKLPYP